MSRRFLAPSKLPKYLMCIICTEVFVDPVCLLCGHTFCKNCIRAWVKSNKACPVCRTPSNLKSLSDNIIAKAVIAEIEVICTYKGCSWTGKLRQSLSHTNTCEFHPDRIEPYISNQLTASYTGENEDIDKPEETLLSSLYKSFPKVLKTIYQQNYQDCPIPSYFHLKRDED